MVGCSNLGSKKEEVRYKANQPLGSIGDSVSLIYNAENSNIRCRRKRRQADRSSGHYATAEETESEGVKGKGSEWHAGEDDRWGGSREAVRVQ